MKRTMYVERGESLPGTWDLVVIDPKPERQESDTYRISGDKKLILEIIKDFLDPQQK